MRKHLLAITLMLVLSSGCRTSHAETSGASGTATIGTLEAAAPNVLVVVIGGWMSCKQLALSPTPVDMFLHDQAQNLVRNLKTGIPNAVVNTLHVCLGSKPPVAGSPSWYRRSDRPHLVYSNDVTELHNAVRAFATDLGSPAIFMMGHSYGGYVAMETTSKLSDLKLGGLYTIDPISGEACKIVDNLPSSPGNPDCIKAPDSLPNAIIKANTLGWLNLHQDKGPLHSAQIGEAGNVLIELPYGDKSHQRLGIDPKVWSLICSSISKTLGVVEPTNCHQVSHQQTH